MPREKKLINQPRPDADNEVLHQLENGKLYKDMQGLIEKALIEQWNDFLLSGAINTLFDRYTEFFVKPKDTKVRVRKAEETEIETIEDLLAEEESTLQADRIIVGEKYLKMGALLVFLNSLLNDNFKSISRYYKFRPKMQEYLLKVANAGGQSIIDKIPSSKSYTFRLSNKELKKKIRDRVDTLIRGLDETGRKRLTNQLLIGIRKGETKTEMINRVQQKGKDIAKNRAKRIVLTETEAANEFIRYETARLNGVRYKVWNTVGDERVCPICGPLDGKRINIESNYESGDDKASFGGMYPPAHPMCRCWIDYPLEENLASEFVEMVFNRSIYEEVELLVRKAQTNGELYTTDNEITHLVNPNAIWAGGESLVGPDKNITEYYEAVIEYGNWRDRLKEILHTKNNKLTLDDEHFIVMSGVDQVMVDARGNLSDEGFVQLLHRLGFRRKIPSKNN